MDGFKCHTRQVKIEKRETKIQKTGFSVNIDENYKRKSIYHEYPSSSHDVEKILTN